jgi:hypothetical protein
MKKHWILLLAAILFVIGVFTCIIHGNNFQIGEFAIKYFSAGDHALGVFSIGMFSIGFFSMGIFSIGLFSFGIFNIGLYVIGILTISWRKRFPDLFLEMFQSIGIGTKRPLFVLLLLGVTFAASAQEPHKFQLSGGFGGPFINVSTITSKPSIAIGGGGAAVFNNGLFVGGFGVGTSDMLTVKSSVINYKLQVEYGGFWLGYIRKLYKKYKISASMKAGFGEAKMIDDSQKQLYYDDIVVFSPEISISRKISGISAIELGAFYNAFTDINFQNYRNKDFSSLGVSLKFKFGGGYF